MTMASVLLIGKAAVKLGLPAWEAYCEMNKNNVEAFSTERIQKILNDYVTVDEQLRAAGLDPDEFK